MRLSRTQVSQEFNRIEAGRGARKRKPPAPVAVCLIGYRERVPRSWSDNLGAWPVRIAVTEKPLDKPRPDVVRRADFEQPVHEIVVLEHVYVPSKAHAARLKAHLDRALLGGSAKNYALRHGWRDIPPTTEPGILWPVILEAALADIRRREEFSVSVPTSRRAAR